MNFFCSLLRYTGHYCLKYSRCIGVTLTFEVCSKIFEEFIRIKNNWHVIFLCLTRKINVISLLYGVQIGVSNLLSRHGTSSVLFQVKFLIGTGTLQKYSRKCDSFKNGICISSFVILFFPLSGYNIRNTRYVEMYFM